MSAAAQFVLHSSLVAGCVGWSFLRAIGSDQAEWDWTVHFCLSPGRYIIPNVSVRDSGNVARADQQNADDGMEKMWSSDKPLTHVQVDVEADTSKQIPQLSFLSRERAEGWISPLNVLTVRPQLKIYMKKNAQVLSTKQEAEKKNKNYGGLCPTGAEAWGITVETLFISDLYLFTDTSTTVPHVHSSHTIISVDIFMTVAVGYAVTTSAGIFIWWWRQISGRCQDFIYLSAPTMAASLPLQLVRRLHHANFSPSQYPFLPLGPGIPVSHVLSVRLQAPLSPAQISSPSSLSSHPTPLDSFCVSPSTTSVLSEHSQFFFIIIVHTSLLLAFVSSTCLIWKSLEPIVHAVQYVLLDLPHF